MLKAVGQNWKGLASMPLNASRGSTTLTMLINASATRSPSSLFIRSMSATSAGRTTTTASPIQRFNDRGSVMTANKSIGFLSSSSSLKRNEFFAAGGLALQKRFESTRSNPDGSSTATVTTTIPSDASAPITTTTTTTSTIVDPQAVNAAATAVTEDTGGWGFVEKFQEAMMWIHDFTGTPWWGTLVICTLVMRGITIPFAAKSFRQAALMMQLKPYLEEFTRQIKAADTVEQKKDIQKKQMKFTLENGYQPLAMILPMFTQAVPFLLFFLAVRQMVLVDPSFAQEGLLWFKDLSLPDVFPYILPATTMLTMLASTEAAVRFRNGEITATQNIIRFMCIASFFITKSFPTGLHVYWITTNIFSFLQSYAFSRVDWIKRLFKIENKVVVKGAPPIKGAMSTPVGQQQELFATKPKSKKSKRDH